MILVCVLMLLGIAGAWQGRRSEADNSTKLAAAKKQRDDLSKDLVGAKKQRDALSTDLVAAKKQRDHLSKDLVAAKKQREDLDKAATKQRGDIMDAISAIASKQDVPDTGDPLKI